MGGEESGGAAGRGKGGGEGGGRERGDFWVRKRVTSCWEGRAARPPSNRIVHMAASLSDRPQYGGTPFPCSLAGAPSRWQILRFPPFVLRAPFCPQSKCRRSEISCVFGQIRKVYRREACDWKKERLRSGFAADPNLGERRPPQPSSPLPQTPLSTPRPYPLHPWCVVQRATFRAGRRPKMLRWRSRRHAAGVGYAPRPHRGFLSSLASRRATGNNACLVP